MIPGIWRMLEVDAEDLVRGFVSVVPEVVCGLSVLLGRYLKLAWNA